MLVSSPALTTVKLSVISLRLSEAAAADAGHPGLVPAQREHLVFDDVVHVRAFGPTTVEDLELLDRNRDELDAISRSEQDNRIPEWGVPLAQVVNPDRRPADESISPRCVQRVNRRESAPDPDGAGHGPQSRWIILRYRQHASWIEWNQIRQARPESPPTPPGLGPWGEAPELLRFGQSLYAGG